MSNGPSDPTGRIKTLRERCLARKHLVCAWPDPLVTTQSLKASEGVSSWQVRMGMLTRDRLAAAQFAVDDQELLMGRLAPAPTAPAGALEAAREYLKPYPFPGGQTGHCELHLQRLFAVGIDGLREEIHELMTQAQVTPEMTTWAVAILHDPVTYPMYSTAMMTFGAQLVLARVEWHPPDFQNGVVHRGVTLYVPV